MKRTIGEELLYTFPGERGRKFFASPSMCVYVWDPPPRPTTLYKKELICDMTPSLRTFGYSCSNIYGRNVLSHRNKTNLPVESGRRCRVPVSVVVVGGPIDDKTIREEKLFYGTDGSFPRSLATRAAGAIIIRRKGI